LQKAIGAAGEADRDRHASLAQVEKQLKATPDDPGPLRSNLIRCRILRKRYKLP